MTKNSDPIVAEQTFDAAIAAVWQAITDPDRMRRWFFDPITDFEPRVGFETEFTVRFEDRDYLHQWKVTEVVQERRLVYDWRYGGFPGRSSVRWELSETPAGTKLRLTHEGHETFPEDDPAFSREQGQAGWDYLVGKSLKAFLERQG